MAIPEEASKLLENLREKQGWTMTELAEHSGVSATTIANYERGTRANGDPFEPTQRMLMKIGAAFPAADRRELLDVFGYEGGASGPVSEQRPEPVSTAEPQYDPGLDAGDSLEVIGWIGDPGDVLIAKDPHGRVRLWVERTQEVAKNAKGG